MSLRKASKWAAKGSIAVAAIVCFLLIGCYYFLGAGYDDCFITYWAALQFAQGKGFVNYNYVPCEISSSLLHVVSLGYIHALIPIDMYLTGKLFGVAMGLACFLLGVAFSPTVRAAALFSAILLINQSFVYWSFGGLESSLAAFVLFVYCLTMANALEGGSWLYPTAAGLLVAMARPEGFVLVILVAAVLCVVSYVILGQEIAKHLLKHLILLVAVLALVAVARYLALGSMWPNPVYAKTQQSVAKLVSGLHYSFVYGTRPWFILGVIPFLVLFAYDLIVSLIRDHTLDPRSMAFGTTLIGYTCFIAIVGGDRMEHARFFSHIAPSLAFALTLSAEKILGSRNKRAPMRLAVLFGLLVAIVCYGLLDVKSVCSRRNPAMFGIDSVHDIMMLNSAQRRDIVNLLPYIQLEFPQLLAESSRPPVVLSYQAGFFPYMLRKCHPEARFLFIDSGGLTEPSIAKMNMPKGWTGIMAQYDLAGILRGEYGDYSRHIKKMNPCVVYKLAGKRLDRRLVDRMKTIGYEVDWFSSEGSVGGAIVFRKVGSQL